MTRSGCDFGEGVPSMCVLKYVLLARLVTVTTVFFPVLACSKVHKEYCTNHLTTTEAHDRAQCEARNTFTRHGRYNVVGSRD